MSMREGDVLQCAKLQGQNGEFQPVLQCLHAKHVSGPNNADRYRVILSDGRHFMQGMLATQINHYATSGSLTSNTVLKAKKFLTNIIQGRPIVILMELDVIRQENDRVGDPVDIEKTGVLKEEAASAAQPLYNTTNMNQNQPVKSSPNPYTAPPSRVTPAAPIVRSNNTNNTPYTSIAALNMYHNRWTIRARVTSKGDIRTWSNAKGEGSLFSIELLDSTMDVRATFFKEAVDKFYHFLEQGKVYTFSGGRLKVANAQWNTCKSSFEITFDQNSEIHRSDDDGGIGAQQYEFVKIDSLEAVEPGRMVDICAIVQSVGTVANLVSKKSGKELTKCELVLVDSTSTQVSLTLWGEKANEAPNLYGENVVVAVKRAKVSDYGGRSLSLAGSIQVKPMELPEAQELSQWWQASGSTVSARSLSSSGGGAGSVDSFDKRKDIAAIQNEHLGRRGDDQVDWLSFKATITFVKKDKEGGAWYTACPNANEPCKNRFKVVKTNDHEYYCDKCNNHYPNCVHRWIFSGVVEDSTSSTWVSFFNEQAEKLLGQTADQVHESAFPDGQQDQDVYDSVFAGANHSEWIFKCKVKSEIVNEESRVKTSVVALHPVDYVQESKDMLRALENM